MSYLIILYVLSFILTHVLFSIAPILEVVTELKDGVPVEGPWSGDQRVWWVSSLVPGVNTLLALCGVVLLLLLREELRFLATEFTKLAANPSGYCEEKE